MQVVTVQMRLPGSGGFKTAEWTETNWRRIPMKNRNPEVYLFTHKAYGNSHRNMTRFRN